MIKKIAFILFAIFAAIKVSNADTTTSRLGLTKPSVGSANWGVKLNTNMDTIDSGVALQSSTNTFTQVQTFTGGIVISSGITISSTVWILDGTQSVPGLGFSNDTDNGIRRSASNAWHAVAGGVDVASFTTAGVSILGTNTNNSANTGFVGEYVSSVTAGATNLPTSTQYGDLIQITLTAGDWDINGCLNINKNGATITQAQIAISTNSGNSLVGTVEGDNLMDIYPPADHSGVCIPNYRWSSSATSTIYLKYYGAYSAATPTARGRISARRVR